MVSPADASDPRDLLPRGAAPEPLDGALPSDGPPVPLPRSKARRPAASLELEIPWHERLSTRLFATWGLFALATTAAIFLCALAVQHHLLAQVVEESDLVSQTIGNALHRAMLQDRRGDAYAIMEDIARQPGIERIRLMDESGKVTYSTEPAEVGFRVPRGGEACWACHRAGVPRGSLELAERRRVYSLGGRRLLGILTPLRNEASCSAAECHAHRASSPVLGVLDVGISLERLDRKAAAFRGRAVAAALAAAALLGLLAFLVARRQLIRPVAALVEATRRVASDQLEAEIPITWSGELGALAASFNDMTRSLRQARVEVKGLMQGLEREVHERTAALRSAQDQLVRSEKLSSLGRLAASIAHEINNPLAGILTFAKLLVRTLEQGQPDEATRKTLVKHLMLVEREAERCTAIVRNLLDFARERPLSVKDVDVNLVLEEALQLLAHPLELNGVKLEKDLGVVPKVRADFGQLRQACVNVIMNACEAVPRGGRIRVTTRLSDAGRSVEISFLDDGPGIPQDQLARIFDPFFTTKEKGTGLGLSVVYGIVERHGGSIDVKSTLGLGTRVTIRLAPAASGARTQG